MGLSEDGYAKLYEAGLEAMKCMPSDSFDGAYDSLVAYGVNFASEAERRLLLLLAKYCADVAEVGAALVGEDDRAVTVMTNFSVGLAACAAYGRTLNPTELETN